MTILEPTYSTLMDGMAGKHSGDWSDQKKTADKGFPYSVALGAGGESTSALTCSLSLRNLVLRYEYGRVFPAGKGPNSPSRDATSWLSTQFSRSVETRRRFWLVEDGVHPVRLFPSANLVPSGKRWHTKGRYCRGTPGRAPQHTQTYRGTFYRMSKHQMRRRRRAARSSTSQGSA